jgi:SAM-dependent methyltransferase
MDRLAELDPVEAVGGLWDEIGPLQLEYLKGLGLRPDQLLLDIGCGSLRGGIPIISYLDRGRYWGTEISPGILAAGQKILAEQHLTHKEPVLRVVDGFEFSELGDQKFDFVQAFGVFTDMPADTVTECFQNVTRVMRPGSVFCASFAPAVRYMPDPVRVQFRYPWTFFQELADRNDMSIASVPGIDHPKGHVLMAATLKERLR